MATRMATATPMGMPTPTGSPAPTGTAPVPIGAASGTAVEGLPASVRAVVGTPAHPHGGVHRDATGEGPGRRQGVLGHGRRPAADRRGLLAVGFVGGLVPSPSALVVLLGGIALGRAWFGVLLVLAYGVGMALALVGVGLVLVRARGWLEHRSAARAAAGGPRQWLPAVGRRLPTLTAGLVLVVGVVLTVQALAAV